MDSRVVAMFDEDWREEQPQSLLRMYSPTQEAAQHEEDPQQIEKHGFKLKLARALS